MRNAAKLKNWWWYHRVPLIIGALAAAALLYMLSLKSDVPDHHIAVVAYPPLREEEIEAAEAQFSAKGRDANGDGEVVVEMHHYAIDLANDSANAGYDNYQSVAALDADLVGQLSGLFLLQDVAAFQASTNGILAEDYIPWENGLSLARRKDAREADVLLFEQFR